MAKTNVDLQLVGDATIVLQQVWLISINQKLKLKFLREVWMMRYARRNHETLRTMLFDGCGIVLI